MAIVLIAVGLFYNFGLFYMIMKRKISYRQKDHDAFIKRKEIEYVLEISDSWRKQSFFLFSSYKGSKLRMYFKPVFNIFVLFLICVHSFCEDKLSTKGSIFSVSLTLAAVSFMVIRPFRCASTNFLVFLMLWHLCFPVYMVAETIQGMQHGLLTNTYFSI
mmetsp:Transcript_32381/g.36916  ORF Transcript_32381/g.36916 Transcript_32381/m.36916 type:complete len:160 (-) Transcript_32381:418-897(-)